VEGGCPVGVSPALRHQTKRGGVQATSGRIVPHISDPFWNYRIASQKGTTRDGCVITLQSDRSGLTSSDHLPSLVLVAQRFAGWSVDEMRPCTSWASYDLINLVIKALLFVQPCVLDVQTGSRTLKNEVGHRPK
jgi:hypothetical protein